MKKSSNSNERRGGRESQILFHFQSINVVFRIHFFYLWDLKIDFWSRFDCTIVQLKLRCCEALSSEGILDSGSQLNSYSCRKEKVEFVIYFFLLSLMFCFWKRWNSFCQVTLWFIYFLLPWICVHSRKSFTTDREVEQASRLPRPVLKVESRRNKNWNSFQCKTFIVSSDELEMNADEHKFSFYKSRSHVCSPTASSFLTWGLRWLFFDFYVTLMFTFTSDVFLQ